MQVIINSVHQLESLLNKYKKVDFIFEFSGLSYDENKLWLEKIRRNYFACGCSMGRLFMMYALLLNLSGLLFIYFFQKGKLPVMIYLYSVLFIFLMAGLGKAVGKFIANKNLKKGISQLQNYLV
jgi:hypothetical protein